MTKEEYFNKYNEYTDGWLWKEARKLLRRTKDYESQKDEFYTNMYQTSKKKLDIILSIMIKRKCSLDHDFVTYLEN